MRWRRDERLHDSIRMSVRNLSILTGVGSPVPVPPAVMDALAAVEIVTAIGERGSFRLFFRLDRRMQLPTRFRFDSGDLPRVVLVFGTGGAASVAMDGVVVEQTVSAATRDAGPMLVVGGEDLTRLMDLNGTITRTFPGLPANVRVQTLLAAYAVFGVTPVVIPPPVGDVPAALGIPEPPRVLVHQGLLDGFSDRFVRTRQMNIHRYDQT
jgi:hypothetical protein